MRSQPTFTPRMVTGVAGVNGFTLNVPGPNCQYETDARVSSTPSDPVTRANAGACRNGCITNTCTSRPKSAATTIEAANASGVGQAWSCRSARNTNAVYIPIAPCPKFSTPEPR